MTISVMCSLNTENLHKCTCNIGRKNISNANWVWGRLIAHLCCNAVHWSAGLFVNICLFQGPIYRADSQLSYPMLLVFVVNTVLSLLPLALSSVHFCFSIILTCGNISRSKEVGISSHTHLGQVSVLLENLKLILPLKN